MTTAIAIRDELRYRLPIIRPLADLIIGYAVCRGDLLLYAPMAHCELNEDGPPLVSRSDDSSVSAHIDIEDGALLLIDDDVMIWRVQLADADDPFATLANRASNRFAYCHGWKWSRMEIDEQLETTITVCLTHLLRGP